MLSVMSLDLTSGSNPPFFFFCSAYNFVVDILSVGFGTIVVIIDDDEIWILFFGRDTDDRPGVMNASIEDVDSTRDINKVLMQIIML